MQEITSSPVTSRTPGRPSTYSEQTIEHTCHIIGKTGVSDTAAGIRAGVPVSTLSRWKDEYEDLELRLDMAREEFREAKLGIISEAAFADGRRDWRAAAWILERTFPEEYSRRALSKPKPEPVAEASGISLEDLVQIHLQEQKPRRTLAPSTPASPPKPKRPSPSKPAVPKLPKL